MQGVFDRNAYESRASGAESERTAMQAQLEAAQDQVGPALSRWAGGLQAACALSKHVRFPGACIRVHSCGTWHHRTVLTVNASPVAGSKGRGSCQAAAGAGGRHEGHRAGDAEPEGGHWGSQTVGCIAVLALECCKEVPLSACCM